MRIAGVWRLDRAPAELFLQQQLQALGCVRSELHCSRTSPFGVAVAAGPGAGAAVLVKSGSPGRQLLVAADARLDNRRELAQQLGLDSGETNAGQVILAAYQRWGEECPRYLLGDFAFAVWDEQAERLLLARDPFGIRPLFYHYTPGNLFAFSSRLQAVRMLPGVSQELNRDRLVGFLCADYEDTAATFYAQVCRLSPAHRLQVTRSGIQTSPFWRLDPDREAPQRSHQEYADQFRSLFVQAVERNLEQPTTLGALVSGGLDSSSIAAIARRALPREQVPELPTYSLVFNTVRESDEREYVEAALAEGGYRNRRIVGDEISPLAELEEIFRVHDEPVHAPNLFLHRGMWAAAQEEGCQAILDGLDGDSTVSHGYNLLATLVEKGRIPAFLHEAWAVSQRMGIPFPVLVYRHWLGPLRLRLQPHRRKPSQPEPPLLLLRPEVRAQYLETKLPKVDLGARARGCAATRNHYQKLTSGLLAHCFEAATVDAAEYEIEPRFPFCHRDLVEFCLSLPPEAKMRKGMGRAVMRDALVGILPEKVRLRGTKSNLGHAFTQGMLRFEREQVVAGLARSRDRLADYVDPEALEATFQRYLGGDLDLAVLVWRPLVLALWLEWQETGGRTCGYGRPSA